MKKQFEKDADKFWDDVQHMKSIDKALEYIFDNFDDWFTAGNFITVDYILYLGFDYINFINDIKIGILAASLPAKDKLPYRARYRDSVYDHMLTRQKLSQDKIQGLLNGL